MLRHPKWDSILYNRFWVQPQRDQDPPNTEAAAVIVRQTGIGEGSLILLAEFSSPLWRVSLQDACVSSIWNIDKMAIWNRFARHHPSQFNNRLGGLTWLKQNSFIWNPKNLRYGIIRIYAKILHDCLQCVTGNSFLINEIFQWLLSGASFHCWKKTWKSHLRIVFGRGSVSSPTWLHRANLFRIVKDTNMKSTVSIKKD